MNGGCLLLLYIDLVFTLLDTLSDIFFRTLRTYCLKFQFGFILSHYPMSATDLSSQPGAGWDESQCTAALAQMEQLQSQVRNIEGYSQNMTDEC